MRVEPPTIHNFHKTSLLVSYLFLFSCKVSEKRALTVSFLSTYFPSFILPHTIHIFLSDTKASLFYWGAMERIKKYTKEEVEKNDEKECFTDESAGLIDSFIHSIRPFCYRLDLDFSSYWGSRWGDENYRII